MSKILLASGSVYRARQLEALGIDFTTQSPNIDETINQDEPPIEACCRLAKAKAKAALEQTQFDGTIIASDQIAIHETNILGKPGNHENAFAQLKKLQNQKVTFISSIAILHPKRDIIDCDYETTNVQFRALSSDDIAHYLMQDQPYDCAGAFKIESRGILLFKYVESRDPEALIGLPIIKLNHLLMSRGIDLLHFKKP